MDDLNLSGVIRGRNKRKTRAADFSTRPADLVERNYTAAPNALRVDLTHLSTWSGFVYVAFVIDHSPGSSSTGAS